VRHSHLGLPVRDSERSQRFYATYFGFELESASTYGDGTVIIRDAHGFDLALHEATDVAPPNEFLHFGFRAAGPDDVRAQLARLEADGVPVLERDDEREYVGFKCADPDGHRVEVYWEPMS
jgi:catechol 2,3-dioxygenase-like lactoylglutathione lyase family enzyme